MATSLQPHRTLQPPGSRRAAWVAETQAHTQSALSSASHTQSPAHTCSDSLGAVLHTHTHTHRTPADGGTCCRTPTGGGRGAPGRPRAAAKPRNSRHHRRLHTWCPGHPWASTEAVSRARGPPVPLPACRLPAYSVHHEWCVLVRTGFHQGREGIWCSPKIMLTSQALVLTSGQKVSLSSDLAF